MGQEWSLGDLGGGGGGGIGDHPCPRLRMQGGQERWRKEEWEGLWAESQNKELYGSLCY